MSMTRAQALAQLTGAGQPYELAEQNCRGRTCRVFVNAPPTLRELYRDARSDLPLFVYGDERLTFEDIWQRSCRLARLLHDTHGVRPGDRVAISMRNYPEWVVAFNAATSIGAIAVAMNALWQPEELAYGLEDSAPRVLIADAERLERLARCTRIPADLAVLSVRAGQAHAFGARDLDEALQDVTDATLPAIDMHPDDDATILYTSGSTGHPKGAVSSHRNIISALLSWELDAHAGLLARGESPTEPETQAATLLAVPLFHVTGLHAVLLSSYRARRRVVSMYRWDVAQAAELIEAERISSFVAPAAMTGDLVQFAAEHQRDLSSLVTVGGGGAPRAPEQVQRIRSTFANALPNTGWGMTETNAIGTGIGGQDYLDRPSSCGRPAAVLDLRVVGEDGRELPTGEPGELQVRGTSVIRGYWHRPDADADTFDGPWLRTGDVARIDEDGFVYIVDRIKDVVIRGGENIGCGAVEAALLEHPAVKEASVYGVPDQRLGEEVGATVFAPAGVDEAELLEFVGARLARFEVPRYLQIVDQPLPRTASGKILKRELRDAARQRWA